MANFDLDYEGSVVQDILDTGKELEDNGYIFMGTATPSTIPGTPTERVAYIGGPGTYNNFGTTVVVPSGSVVVITYSGSAWSKTVINASLPVSTTLGSDNTTIPTSKAVKDVTDAINTKLGEGYVYAGIATATTNPGTPTGKVFYLAKDAGTYTNFGGLTLTEGVNILKYNGTAWSSEQVIGIDDNPTHNSNNLTKSGGIDKAIKDVSSYFLQNPSQTWIDNIIFLAFLPEFKGIYKTLRLFVPNDKSSFIIWAYPNENASVGDEHVQYSVPNDRDNTLLTFSSNGTIFGYIMVKDHTAIGGDGSGQLLNPKTVFSYCSKANADILEAELNEEIQRAKDDFYNLKLEDVTGSPAQATQITECLKKNEGTVEDPDWHEISNFVIPSATYGKAGLMSTSDKKLYTKAALPYISQMSITNVMTPEKLKDFIVDFKVLEERVAGYDYGIMQVNNGLPASSGHTYYLGIYRWPTGETPQLNVNMVAVSNFYLGSTKPSIKLIKDNKSAVLVNWDAASDIQFGGGSLFNLFKDDCKFNQDYIFDLSCGAIPNIINLSITDENLDKFTNIWHLQTPNQTWINNIVYLAILPEFKGKYKTFRGFVPNDRGSLVIWAYENENAAVGDAHTQFSTLFTGDYDNKLQPISNDNSTLGYIIIKNHSELTADGGGVLLNPNAVFKYSGNKNVDELSKELDNLELIVDNIGDESIVYSKSQDIEGCNWNGYPFQGQAVLCKDANGIKFNTVKLPFASYGEERNVMLVIGQTDTSGESGVRDALKVQSNVLLSKVISLPATQDYNEIYLGQFVEVNKYYLVIGVYCHISGNILQAYHEDYTGLEKITYLYLNNEWYAYSGGSVSGGYGAYPILYITDAIARKLGNLQTEVETQQYELDNISSVRISMPDKITAVIGDTLQIYFRSLLKVFNPYNKNVLVSCQKGNQYPRYFEFTPVSGDSGNTDFALKVRNDNFVSELASKTIVLQTVGSGQSPASNKNILCIGDSLTAPGTWIEELSRRLTGTGGTPSGRGLQNLSFVGSMGSGNAKYYGVGGWSWGNYTTEGVTSYRFYVSGVSSVLPSATYTNNGITFRVLEVNITNGTGNILCQLYSGSGSPTVSGILTKSSGSGDSTINYSNSEQAPGNPFWDDTNDKMSFVRYANDYCNNQIDAVYVLLGANNVSPNNTDYANTIAQVKTFADTLHTEFPNAKMKIMGCAGVSHNGGCGANYGASGTGYADEYGIFLAMLNLNEAYQDFAKQEGYSSFVEYVDVMSQLDSEYNFPRQSYPVNTRNSDVTEYKDVNGVHPSTHGYYQIADVAYRNVIKELCQ